jgi:hypothetical protein
MRVESGDIWDRFRKSFIVVPTNIGWKKPDKSGKPGPNVMGRGMALEASKRVPELAQTYGEYCARFGSTAEVTFDLTSALILFPTKPLASNPSMSWKNHSDPVLIDKSSRELAAAEGWISKKTIDRNSEESEDRPNLEDDTIYLPLVGCGEGKLSEAEVLPILHRHLSDRFVLVRYRPF